jgi:hypothetical protein
MPNSGLFERFYLNQLDYMQIDGKLAVDEVLRFENLNIVNCIFYMTGCFAFLQSFVT